MHAKKLIKVALDENESITHDFIGKFGGASVLLKKAPEGTGVIAGGPARAVIETGRISRTSVQNLLVPTISRTLFLLLSRV